MATGVPFFRPMQPEDEKLITEMIMALYHSLGAPDGYMTIGKIKATFEQIHMQSDSLQLDVFEMDGEIAGYATLFSYWYNEFGGRVLNVDELFIKPEFRGRGISTQYLTELSKPTKKYVALSLEVLPSNEGAYSLYKRIGFREKETITLYKMLAS
jgi:ribosomal protein S18 acetylase RimI-like enzyme